VRTVTWDGQEITVPTLENPIDFEGLCAQNSDLVGWIKIRALDLSYPVMQADDNEYYLHNTFEKEYNFAGCIFLNCDNASDFSDMNSIVYGHNMKNGSMFGLLKTFQDEEVFNKSKYFWIYTPDLIFQYRIFSMAVVNNTGIAYQTYYTEESFDELIDYAYSNSEVDTSGVEVSRDDHIVTLSTCTGDSSTRRVVFGKLVRIYGSK
jgi:sortase B